MVQYPGHQRFFPRAAGNFGVGRRPTHLRPETGNRARKVSGTQGNGAVTMVRSAMHVFLVTCLCHGVPR